MSYIFLWISFDQIFVEGRFHFSNVVTRKVDSIFFEYLSQSFPSLNLTSHLTIWTIEKSKIVLGNVSDVHAGVQNFKENFVQC